MRLSVSGARPDNPFLLVCVGALPPALPVRHLFATRVLAVSGLSVQGGEWICWLAEASGVTHAGDLSSVAGCAGGIVAGLHAWCTQRECLKSYSQPPCQNTKNLPAAVCDKNSNSLNSWVSPSAPAGFTIKTQSPAEATVAFLRVQESQTSHVGLFTTHIINQHHILFCLPSQPYPSCCLSVKSLAVT